MTNRRYIPRFREFSGGLNLRDAQSELALDDLAAAYNVTLDERGGVSSRLGYIKWNTSSYGASPPSNLFWWGSGPGGPLGHSYTQVGASLYEDLNLTPIKTFTTTARCAMADFVGKLCIVHPVDGMFTYDGVTLAAVGAGPKADSLAVWQNKLWANDKSGTNPARVNFCAIGDPTTWGTFNDIRDTDNSQVVNVFATAGADIIGRPTLLVFKLRSSYRIYDSTAGAYQTLDGRVGAGGALAVTALSSRVFAISSQGIFETDGVGPLKAVGDRLRPLWSNAQLNVSQMGLAAATSYGVHAYFSLPQVGASANNLMIDYDTSIDAFTANSNAASCYAVDFSPSVNSLLSGSPTVNGQLYQQLTGGTDDGTAINAYMQTSFIELHYGLRARLNEARVNGRGAFTLSPLYDYDPTPTITRAISVPTGSATVHGGYQSVYNLGQAKTIAFRVEATTSTTATIPLQMSGSTTRTVGAWGLYGIDPYPVPAPLGRT